MTTVERVEMSAACWPAPAWADHCDFCRGTVVHVLWIEHPADVDVVAFLRQADDLQRGVDGVVRVVRGDVSVSIDAPAVLGSDSLTRWGHFTVEQARALSLADLPGVHAEAWPKVQQVVAGLLASHDAAVSS